MRYFLAAAVLILAIGAVLHHRAIERACTGTINPAMCELGLMAGDSERVAHDAGNGIYGTAHKAAR